MKHNTFLALGAAAVLAVGLAACAPTAPEPGESSAATGPSDETLSIGTTTDVVNFNPVLGNSRTDSWVTNLMYPHLLSISDDGTKDAHVATEWGYVDDTTGFYEIRDDLTWSDGEPLTAEDVAWTLNAVKRDQAPGTFYGQLGNLDTATAVSDTR
ncbi:MAG: ABC transporter substrate-binding protein, partial [Microbacterium sp.]|nr:ABC transporter substrate-binding protein [Microbacterium sp.]